jgi:hypothetical protein
MTGRFSRPCLKCGALSPDTYCPQHRSEVNKQRERKRNTEEHRAKKKALYGGDYRRRRREALAGASVCYLCKETFKPGDRVEADHLFPTDPTSPLVPAHRLCNQRKGDKPLTN